MLVKVIAHTAHIDYIPGYVPHPEDTVPRVEEVIQQAGRNCYGKSSFARPNPATARHAGYLANLIDKGHGSVFEHASVTFYIAGVSRNFTHELIRHRHLSFSEISQRYVDPPQEGLGFVEHPAWRLLTARERELIKEVWRVAVRAYEAVAAELTRQGLPRKRVREAARGVLPGGMETRIVVTGNLRAWREMLRKRLEVSEEGKPLADLEFYEVAKRVLAELRKLAPNAFQDFPVLESLPEGVGKH